jgi:hypothetical protein
MSQPNFSTMTRSQLWHYVVENRTNDEAFYALMDKARENPGVEIRSMEHLAELLEEQRKAQEEQSD